MGPSEANAQVLVDRIERLELQVERLTEAVRDLNTLMGNPLGIVDAASELPAGVTDDSPDPR